MTLPDQTAERCPLKSLGARQVGHLNPTKGVTSHKFEYADMCERIDGPTV